MEKRKILVGAVLLFLLMSNMALTIKPNNPSSRVTPTPVPTLPTISGSYLPASNIAGPWRLVFDDEFDKGTLDLNKWQPNWLGPDNTSITKPVNGYEESCYNPKQVTVISQNPDDSSTSSSGFLSLAANNGPCTANNGVTYAYTSGLVNTNKGFRLAYGYMEARIWLPGGTKNIDNWPAFWADGTGKWPTTGEIDIMEGLAGSPSWHYHWGHGGGSQVGGTVSLSPANTGYHTFAADWEPGSITYYYDGARVGQATQGVVSNEMYLILNYAVSSRLSPPIVVPSTLLVDYVRVWQH